jgi:hypothetical protein
MVIPFVDHDQRWLPSGERMLTGPERGCEGSGLDWLLPNRRQPIAVRALSEPNRIRDGGGRVAGAYVGTTEGISEVGCHAGLVLGERQPAVTGLDRLSP